jgi:hypothetical protein
VDLAQDFIVSTLLEGSAQCASILQILEGDCPVPCKPEVEEHEVLSDDRRSGATEVEGERVFNGTKIMELEDEILREEVLRAPDNPTDANRGKSEFVCSIILTIHLARLSDWKPTPGSVDGNNPVNLEIPY